MKKRLYVFVGVFLIILLATITLTLILQTEKLIFSGNENITKELLVLTSGNVDYAYLDLAGSPVQEECYQEFADQATSCGGLDTGTYSVSSGNVYINYTKPLNAMGGIWKIKYGYGFPYLTLTENITIPDSCWDFDINALSLRFESQPTPPGYNGRTLAYCFNGNWNELKSTPSNPLSFYVNPINQEYLVFDGDWNTGAEYIEGEWRLAGTYVAGTLYEEAIIWNLGNYPTNPSLEVGTIDGNPEWSYSGEFKTSETSFDLSLAINSALNAGLCDCVGCYISGETCSIPFIFHSDTKGVLEILKINTSIVLPECITNEECDDSDEYTQDICMNMGNPDAYCEYTTIACLTDVDCDDLDPDTIDTCTNPGQTDSYCENTPIDSDGDGINDVNDDCLQNPGTPEFNGCTAGTLVKASSHFVGPGNHPGVSKQPLVNLEVKVYDASTGSCADNIGTNWQNYNNIVLSCNPEIIKITDSNGEALIGLMPGQYLIIGDDGTQKQLAVSIKSLFEGNLKEKHLKQIIKASGEKAPAKYTEKTDSPVMIIEPEYVVWNETTEEYPFIFESAGNLNITTSVMPPEGFVADHEMLSESVNGEIKALQFYITDIGSDWIPTEIEYEIEYKGEKKKIKSKVGVAMTKKLAKEKDLDTEEKQNKKGFKELKVID